MKKLVLTILMVFVFCWMGHAQEAKYSHIGLRGSYIEWEGEKFMYSLGPTVHIYLSDHLVLNYHIQFGGNHQDNFHVHSYLGGATSVFLALSGLEDEAQDRELKLLGALIAAFIPEGVGYTAKLMDNVYLTPYVNPLGFHISSDAYFSGEVGGRLEFRMNRFNLAPYLSGEVLAGQDLEGTQDLIKGLGAGVSLSYRINE